MLKIISIIILAIAAACRADNVTVNLTWDASPEADIYKYTISWGTIPGVYTNSKTTLGKENTISLSVAAPAPTGYYYAVLKAINTSYLESLPSLEFVFQSFKPGEGKVPSAPLNLHKTVNQQASLEISRDLLVWDSLATLALPSEPRVFVRTTISTK